MHIKRSIKFLLHKRNVAHVKNIMLRMRISFNGNRPIDISIGHKIDLQDWDEDKQVVKKSNSESIRINRTIDEYRSYAEEIFARYELLEKRIPTADEVKFLFNDMIGKSTIDLSQKSVDFFSVFNKFMETVGKNNQWEESTYRKFNTVKNKLQKFDANLSFDSLTEEKMIQYLYFLHDVASYRNTTVAKNIQFVKWFLRWAKIKGYYNGDLHQTFSPKLKGVDGNSKEVIHLTWEELQVLRHFNFPDNRASLSRVRDVFLFLCFTGLRYSDVLKLKRSDVKDNHILVVTKKTNDGVKIELNKFSREILDKYKDMELGNDKALPTISLQKMNDRLKEMGRLAGIDDPQRIVYFRKNKRIEEVYPKYALLTTHCGRRTFIVNALYLGIASEVIMKWTGHSDHKSMKPYVKIVDALKEKEMKKFDVLFKELD